MSGLVVLLACLAPGCLAQPADAAATPPAATAQDSDRRSPIADLRPPTVGMEGQLEAALPGPRIEARPVNDKSLVVVRIAGTRPHGTLTWYDLRYIGLVPGTYDLRDYLRRQDGTNLSDLPPLEVRVVGLLPAQHLGELIEPPRNRISVAAWYRPVMGAAAVLWGVAGLGLALTRRRRRAAPVAGAPAHPPTLAERLRPLVEQAAEGRLSTDGQALLERLLIAHWRERLNLTALGHAEAMARLRDHAEAGQLLRALEIWLHCPPGGTRVDVAGLLAPYRSLPGPAEGPSQQPVPQGQQADAPPVHAATT